VTTAADTFADFVDHLAEALDESGDRDLTGEDLAARFHFSRFHFDRMIRGVAGEPPQAFRRRILLERAAYRMVEHHIWLTGEMVRLAGRLTDEELDQSIELDVDDDVQTIRSLLSRLIGQMGMWNAAVAMRDYDWSVEEHESLSSMRERLADEGPTFLSQVREVVEQDRLDDTFVDALCEPADVFTYGGMIAHVLTFAAHRRTLVALALSKHGVDELGWGDPMVWVATPGS
jgi:hypothetical protein